LSTVFLSDARDSARAYERAMAREVERLAVFTHDLFATPHDQANRAAVASVSAAELDFAGIALHASTQRIAWPIWTSTTFSKPSVST
jgi:hypothetical protein